MADSTVTANPKAAACVASALDDPPFTDVDKISTEPDDDAFAGGADTTTPAAATVTPAATTTTGSRLDASFEGTVTSTLSR